MKRILSAVALLIVGITASAQANGEVMYHVFQRSFFDSNGDGHGDLKGIKQKLDYLQGLGVTTILLTPLYQSDFYHNYFATDFEKIDPAYGTFNDYSAMVAAAHLRDMKVYQDVEMQYVTGNHPWFKESYKKPGSQYAGYLYYNDQANEKPYYFLDVPEFTTYNNRKEQIIVVDMRNQKVKDYTLKVLKYWADPNGDGKFNDGVDGFRLDHMMDNLDNSGKLKNLFANFWSPLLAQLKKVNPKLQIVAEQANWNSYGYDYFTKGNVDRVFAFRLKQAITTFDKKKIEAAADSTFSYLPKDKHQVVFIENHDIKRFASEKEMNAGKLRIGAALNILIGGVPSLYYGQELGMKGEQMKGMTDGNDIPIREAFEWYKAEEGHGMATWYKNTGEWWDKRNMKPNDGISLEEQQADPKSLYNYYRELIAIKKKYPEFATGTYSATPNDNDKVFTFLRKSGKNMSLVVINLSGEQQFAVLLDNDLKVNSTRVLSGNSELMFDRGSRALTLPPYAVQVYRFFPQGPR
ncbi:MAG: alpha-amylase family glycosyl hydrolase [Flavobacterium sp.]